MNVAFWPGKRVLLTGHTGFKGAWLSHWLGLLGAEVTGYSLAPATDPSLFSVLAPWPSLESAVGDVRDRHAFGAAIEASDPEIVIHMAAQALVGESYEDPVGTFSTNVMGTVNLLDLLRDAPTLQVILVITSDKVYQDVAADHHFVEEDRLAGSSPYAASKAAQELITAAYARSYFATKGVAVATCRAGNVIGGGDWAADRLVPDYFRSLEEGKPLELRNPEASRPWQHVLDPLSGYLMYAEHLHAGADGPPVLNFGPSGAALTVAGLVAKLDLGLGRDRQWNRPSREVWREQQHLELDSTAANEALGWRTHIDIDRAVDWTVQWHRAHEAGDDMRAFSTAQIDAYSQIAASG
ncbi:MAG: CDP-glucose 4,6-dehydratase [bacterium]|nr:CDP-glucose 4,6-dehydratase [bacterium]